MDKFYQKGISIIEVTIVLAIIGVLTLVVVPQFYKIRENQVVKSAVEEVLSALGKARSQTLASLNSSEYGIHFQPDRVIIFRGRVFSSSALDNEIIILTTPATISNISLTGEISDIYFNRLSGMPSVFGSVTVSSANYSKVLNISATGNISLN